VPEEPVEDVGHQVPRRTGVEPEAVGFEHARVAADPVVLFEQPHVGAGAGQVRRCRQPAEPPADDDHRPVRWQDVAHTRG